MSDDIEILKKKACAGDLDAMAQLGMRYMRSDGVEHNAKEAIGLWTKASEAGNSDASFYLAVSYNLGSGVEKNCEKACQYYQLAADKGDARAMFYLAFRYIRAEGVGRDLDKANQLLQKALDLGFGKARYVLEALRESRVGFSGENAELRRRLVENILFKTEESTGRLMAEFGNSFERDDSVYILCSLKTMAKVPENGGFDSAVLARSQRTGGPVLVVCTENAQVAKMGMCGIKVRWSTIIRILAENPGFDGIMIDPKRDASPLEIAREAFVK